MPPSIAELRTLLQERFGHAEFREGQSEALEATLAGRDVVAVMPTGGGKSLLYQLPALILPGTTLVVSPLIALMKDQVDALTARGIAAAAVNSTLTPGEQRARLEAAARGEIKLLYLAPERFRNPRFREAAAALKPVLLAIDEAHCISEWGHDFRPDYRRLGEAIELLGRPPIIALTATATPEVRDDIVRELGLRDPLTLVTGFDRKNLFLAVSHTGSDADKLAEMERTIEAAAGPGIVYVSSRKNARRVRDWLGARGHTAGLYHAGLADSERERVQEQFLSGEVPILVATNAFGMGIDKADIRFVVHHDFPKSLEAYYQEVGRAGRDGKPALARLLFNFVDKRIQEFFIEGANPSFALVARVYQQLLASGNELVDTTPSDLAAALGERNDMAVSSALALLERVEAIERDSRSAPGARARPIRVRLRVEPRDLPIDARLLARKLEADRKKLEAVVQFAYHKGCRKERLLAYFGDTRRNRTCDACDGCESRRADRRELTDVEQATAVACLEAVAAVDGRFGRVRVAEVLAGERSEGVERFSLDGLPVWGKLRHLGRKGVFGWLDALLDQGYVGKEELPSGGYVLQLAPAGAEALAGRAPLVLTPPAAAAAARRPARSQPGRRDRPERPGSRQQPALAALPATGAAAADSAPARGLLLALKAWRREEAQRRAVPAYVIFHDAVLESIAAVRPDSRDALAILPGIGPRKLEEYAEAVLALVRQSG